MKKIIGRTLWVVFQTVLLVLILLLAGIYALERGPSTAARDTFVHTVQETSAIKFIANIFLSDETVAEIMTAPDVVTEDTDTSLITISASQETEGDARNNNEPQPDAWGYVDDDGDGIILTEVRGNGYIGYMMIVLDPSRVIVGYVEGEGHYVDDMCSIFGAVAGINAGGFLDTHGSGSGDKPTDTVVSEGTIYYVKYDTAVAAIDENNIMHVGNFDRKFLEENKIRDAAGFGPALIVNGSPCSKLFSGLNPRAAIGQRSDGAILLLAIDGRQVTSIGASMDDLVEVMLRFGAVNACNLDGGSSLQMWYDGEYVNNAESIVGIRKVPSTFLVLPKEGS